jgi:hypothetical protein
MGTMANIHDEIGKYSKSLTSYKEGLNPVCIGTRKKKLKT